MQIEDPKYSKKQLKLQWTNNIVSTHDLLCRCDNPLEHTINTILEQEPNLRFSEETKKKLQKCLTFTAAGKEDGHAADDIIEDGDLETLFAEDFTEDETG